MVSWTRVMPGAINNGGARLNGRLIDELLAHGITPWLILYHCDYSYELYFTVGIFMRGAEPKQNRWALSWKSFRGNAAYYPDSY